MTIARQHPWERPLGAHPAGDGRTCFRVWAPRADAVSVRVGGSDHPTEDVGRGVREAVLDAGHGDRYELVLDGTPLPDPCSRWQPEGLRGPSAVVDPARLERGPDRWRGLDRHDLVLYELHVGTFSDDGTFDGAIAHLRELRELGITAIELMPVAEFPGRHGWGYDGVYLSAAQSSYGGPEGLARLVAAAHAEGLGVILDVVYNHLGASGVKAIEAFGPYFTDKHETFWGKAINFDDAGSGAVREWVLQSAAGWIRDFGIDGLRLDAIHAIRDDSARHVLQDLTDRVHRTDPRAVVIAESGLNDPKVMRPAELGGYGCDAAWADDFHHALRTLVSDEREGYYADFGRVSDLAKAFRRPHVHDGTWSEFRGRAFGAPAFDRPPEQFVVFSQNHDQVGNRALGDRLPARARPLAAFCTLLAPFTPMLFQGEEHGEPAPFQFFSDHIDEEIATATREGRRREFSSFAAFAGEEVPDPQDPATFERSKLVRDRDEGLLDLYRRLLAARRELGREEAMPSYDERARWLRVQRGPYELVCNFAGEPQAVPVAGRELVLATHDDARLADGAVHLGALAGALVR